MKKALFSIALAAGVAFAAPAVAQNISIGTGGTGGVYYPMGGGLANILSKYVSGMQATAEVTGGSVDNLKLLNNGKADVGFSMADAGWDAYKGQDKFTAPVPVRTLAVLYTNRMHVVTVEGTGVQTMADLKGKRVSTGSPGSATEVMAFRLIEAAGLDKDKDLKRERLGVAESVNALKDKKIEAFFWVGGIPTAAVTDLAATPGTKLKLIDHSEFVEAMNKKSGPLYVKDVIPAKSYAGQDSINQIASVWNVLVASEKMSDQTAYNIVKTMFEKKPELVAVHKEAANIDFKYQNNQASPIPYHPGAIKYFKEQGIDVK
jgi:TRAP transporter TAXI family solute receptor